MKILHLCLASFYIDNYSYQENLLPKYHKKMGLDVEIIASMVTFNENGELSLLDKENNKYINENGIPVTRLEYKKGFVNPKLRIYSKTYESIKNSNPDIIFIHGCQFYDIREVARYIQNNPNVKVLVDNHADFSNSARNWLSKNILHKIIWKKSAQIIEPYTERFYGVLPARVKFLEDIYKVPSAKTDLLIMGADDENIFKALISKKNNEIRREFDISQDDFLIVTGGKIDYAKTQTILLMKAVKQINNPKLKLIVFGSVSPELKEEVGNLIDNKNIYHIGWIDNNYSYKLFAEADIAVFPGRHSVYWEQVVALGTPLIVKYWAGTTHIDIGGNVIFLEKDTVDELKKNIEDILYNSEIYDKLKENANSINREKFLYSEIAKKSLK